MYAAQRPETVLFAERGIQVTTARLTVGPQTYPIHMIGGVEPHLVPTQTSGATTAGVFAILLGVLPASCCIWLGDSARTFGITLLVAAIGMIGIAIGHAVTRKAFYGVTVITPSGRFQIAQSPDEAFAHRVMGAMNHALSMR
jgi:hypothetical protein